MDWNQKLRRFGEPIFGADKVCPKRNSPGQHGNNRRRKVSTVSCWQRSYGVYTSVPVYIAKAAICLRVVTGEFFSQSLESRLDKRRFRLGIVHVQLLVSW